MPPASTSPRTLTWLHFSDLHANRPETGWDAVEVLQLLQGDMTRVRDQHGLAPDLIFFTGDAAFGHDDPKKLAAQFDDAELLFDEIRELFDVPRERFFIVPGNHDVHRKSVAKGDTLLLDSLVKEHGDKAVDVVHGMLRDQTTEWKRLVGRLDVYRDFLERYGYTHLLTDGGRLIWRVRVEVHGIDVVVAGLNTSWACIRKGENGQLWTGLEWQIRTLRQKLAGKDGKPDVTIALTHHPSRWLHEYEGNRVERLLESGFDLRFHGHEHEDWIAEKNGHARIGAAACYAQGPRERGYNFGRLNVDDGTGIVWLRQYDATGDGWVTRPIAHKAPDGVWTFHLRPQPERPPPRSRGVFGREQDVKELGRLVAQYRVVSVFGLPGVGKTTLVKELLHTEQLAGARYHHVHIHEVTTFKGLFQQLAPALGAGVEPANAEAAVAKSFVVLEEWAEAVPPTLVHLENAHLLLDGTAQRFREHEIGDFLAAIAAKCGTVSIVLEGQRAFGRGILPLDIHDTLRIGGLDKKALDAFFRASHQSHAVVWRLEADALSEVFQRLGGQQKKRGRRGLAHPLGMVLLASLAASQGETPHDVVRRHPDVFAEELEEKIFGEIYGKVLNKAARRLLDLCALYRDEIPNRHVAMLEGLVSRSGKATFKELNDRCLLRSDAGLKEFSLHQMIGDLVRRRLDVATDDLLLSGHEQIGEIWLAQAKGFRYTPQVLAASEAVYHFVKADVWDLRQDVQDRLLQGDGASELRALSLQLHQQHKFQENRRVLELLVAADDSDVMSHRFLAEAIEKLEGRGAAAAFEHYEKAYELSPKHPANVNNLMRYLKEDDPSRCVAIGEKAIADGVADDYIYAFLAKALEKLGQGDEASALRQRKIEAGSRHPSFYNDEAVHLDKRGRKDEALRVLALAFDRGIDNPHSRAIRDRLVGGDAGSASRQEAIRDGSTNPADYNDEAISLDKQGRTEEALDVLRLAVDRGIADDFIYAVQARLLEKTGAVDEASRLRRQRIDAGSRDPVFYHDEAISLDQQGRTEEALGVLRLAVERGIENEYIRRTLRRMGG